MVKKYGCMAFVVVLAYYLYTVVELMQLRTALVFHHHDKCERVESELPSEDIIVFNRWVIGATGDGINMYYRHLQGENAKPGYLVSVNPFTKKVSKIETLDFPEEFQLNAHGITLHKGKDLYVLSHSYRKGGERVFIFELEDRGDSVIAKYKDTYAFGDVHGYYNGIAVVSPSQFYVTQWIPFADTPQGRDNSFLATLKRMGGSTYLKSNPVRLCTVQADKTAHCVDKTYGYIPNGILLHKGKLYFADSIERTVNVFEVRSNLDLSLIEKVKISHTLDNLCAVGDDVYVTGITKLVDYVLYGESIKNNDPVPHFVPGGFSRVGVKDGKWVAEQVIMQGKISLPSSVAIIDGVVTFTSIIDPAFVFCPMP